MNEATAKGTGTFNALRSRRASGSLKAKVKTGAPLAWASTAPPRVIRNNAENEAALAEFSRLGRLMDAGKATAEERETAKVLLVLIQHYEATRFGDLIEETTPVERLRYLMQESGMGVVKLGLLLGDRGLGSRVLSGERELSKAHIRKLAEHFRLNPGYFL